MLKFSIIIGLFALSGSISAQNLSYKQLYGRWLLIDDHGNSIANFSIKDSLNLFKINSEEKGIPAFYKLSAYDNKTQYLLLGYPRLTDTLYMSLRILTRHNQELILTGYYNVYFDSTTQMWAVRKQSKKRTFKLKFDLHSHQD